MDVIEKIHVQKMASSPSTGPEPSDQLAEGESASTLASTKSEIVEDEAGRLQGLHAEVRDQGELERNIARQVRDIWMRMRLR